MEYRVKLMPRAQQDIEELYEWVVHRAPRQGPLWYNGLVRSLESLSRHPERCPLAPEGHELGEPVRHLLYGKRPYRILFWVKGNEVHVLHIRRGSREYADKQSIQ